MSQCQYRKRLLDTIAARAQQFQRSNEISKQKALKIVLQEHRDQFARPESEDERITAKAFFAQERAEFDEV